jgi:hypothetical protein
MTEVASIRGIAGTVINGVCRDVPTSLSHGYPLFSRGRFMRTGKDRVRLVSAGQQLTISGIFLHGFGSSKEDYADVAYHPAFAGRAFLAYDAPGCGES